MENAQGDSVLQGSQRLGNLVAKGNAAAVAQAVLIVGIGAREHTAGHVANGVQALNGLRLGVQHLALGSDLQAAAFLPCSGS